MVPRLDIKHLTVLAAIAETGSVTATANRLGITQSAVSHRIREAERRLGIGLAARRDGVVVLTPEGQRIRALADRFLDELSRVEQDLEASRSSGRTVVRMGQATYNRYHWLPPFLNSLFETDPDLEIDLSGRATTRPFAALMDGSVDVSTVYGRPSTLQRFRWMKLATDPLVAVVAPTHRFADYDYVDSTTVGDERFFTYPLSAEPGFEWEALLGAPTEPYRRLTPMPTPEAAVDLIRAGFGIGIFSRWTVLPELSDGTLVAKPIGEDGMSLDWWAVMRESDADDSPAGRLARALVRWSEAHVSGLATLGFEGGFR